MPATTSSQSALIDTLRLSPREAEALLDRLQTRRERLEWVHKRRHPRVFFTEIDGVPMNVTHPGGSTVSYRVLPVNLSVGGICVLHGGFVHTGSTIELTLHDIDGFAQVIAGRVARCEHFQDRVHEIGLRFDELIQLDRFSREASSDQQDENLGARKLTGSVLYIEDSTDFRDLMRFHLARIGVEAVAASTGEDGLRMAADLDVDAIAIDQHLPDISGVEVIRQIRDGGATQPIVVITGDTGTDTQEQCLLAGARSVVHKPLTPSDVWDVFATILPTETPPDAVSKTIYSAYWSDRSMRPVITTFLERLPGSLDAMKPWIDGSDPHEDDFAERCMDLRSAAASYGFPQIADACGRLPRETESSRLNVAFNELKRVCDLAIDSLVADQAA